MKVPCCTGGICEAGAPAGDRCSVKAHIGRIFENRSKNLREKIITMAEM